MSEVNNYVTIVFNPSTDKGKEIVDNLINMLGNKEENCLVVAVSLDHEIYRVQLIEESLDEVDSTNDTYSIGRILEARNIGDKSLEDILN